jgi:hypothetical protein
LLCFIAPPSAPLVNKHRSFATEFYCSYKTANKIFVKRKQEEKGRLEACCLPAATNIDYGLALGCITSMME